MELNSVTMNGTADTVLSNDTWRWYKDVVRAWLEDPGSEYAQLNMTALKMDQAYVVGAADRNVGVYSVSDDCFRCPFELQTSLADGVESSWIASTARISTWRVYADTTEQYVSTRNTTGMLCQLRPSLGQFGVYRLNVSEGCGVTTEKEPVDIYLRPGMNRTTKLSEQTKRYLSVVAIKPTKARFFRSSETRCSLDEKGAACVAAHLNLTKKKTQVVISGYLDSSFSPVVRGVVDPYLRRGRNVLVVEIFPLLLRTYPLAARVTRPFGELLGGFLASLTHHGLSASRLELLGASLGAHIASYASHSFWQLTGSKPARLTGLDPAGPCFRNLPYSQRLNRNAAHKVDVLHTNIDAFGIPDPLGHVDFYANGGEYQQSMKKGFIMPCLALCSHVRAAFYWIIAMSNPDKFVGVHCSSVANARRGDCYFHQNNTSNLLGPRTDFKKPGIYYLPTNEAPPYYRGKDSYKKRIIGINTYLLQVAPDDDIVL